MLLNKLQTATNVFFNLDFEALTIWKFSSAWKLESISYEHCMQSGTDNEAVTYRSGQCIDTPILNLFIGPKIFGCDLVFGLLFYLKKGTKYNWNCAGFTCLFV